jgi:hypothetical protein
MHQTAPQEAHISGRAGQGGRVFRHLGGGQRRAIGCGRAPGPTHCFESVRAAGPCGHMVRAATAAIGQLITIASIVFIIQTQNAGGGMHYSTVLQRPLQLPAPTARALLVCHSCALHVLRLAAVLVQHRTTMRAGAPAPPTARGYVARLFAHTQRPFHAEAAATLRVRVPTAAVVIHRCLPPAVVETSDASAGKLRVI